MKRFVGIVILLLASISVFPFFIGTEVLTMPDLPFYEYPMPVAEIFGRVDFGMIYFMLPVGSINEDGSVFIVQNIDMEYLKRFLGAGIALKPKFSENLYMRIATDAPIVEWIRTQQFDRIDLKIGIGLKLGILNAEAGVVGRLKKLPDNTIGMKMGDLYFAALGLSF
ncbi:hypothetical protein JYK00_03155 [Thermosipho ferrireducens]|uniref:Uncharacterized protein n=1 Tax=Thermosipho ferrireducens TaxID=2571116 RepID=A0ABX7S9I0_9BACT|nr:hypothetical protein [Thermosipho ferrireducens]QTA38530.1 hypothetical protein JYK00_03155 [Thermosipho ferrireducens]